MWSISNALLLFFACSVFFTSSSLATNVCDYTECKETAAEILSNLNEKVDPCHDFYEYSCGGRGMNIMSLSKLQTVLNQRMSNDFYANDNLRNHGSKTIREAKKVYDDCVKQGGIFCKSLARLQCKDAFVRLYMEKYFPVAEQRAAQRLISNLRTTFLSDIVDKIPWIDHETKKLVVQNLTELQLNIGYPEWLLDDKELDLECQGIKHNPWPMYPLQVSAEYEKEGNGGKITIPAGILHGSVFNRKVPNYMNFGGAGFIAGHEISHGIYRWTQETTPSSGRDSEFQCVVEQLETIPRPNGKPYQNGTLFVDEMIGDITAVNASLTAYRKLQSKVEEQKMPGLTHFSHDQLFFLSFANTWCSNPNLSFAPSKWPDWSYHPEEFYRIVIPVMNSPDFAKAFNCPVGSPMNPVKKCRLW